MKTSWKNPHHKQLRKISIKCIEGEMHRLGIAQIANQMDMIEL